MKKLLLLIIVSLMLAGVASANTVWDPAGNGIVPPATGNWGDTANWANGLPVSAGDGSLGNDDKAVFNLADAAECIVDSPQVCRVLAMGDGNPLTGTFLRIVDGGYLNILQPGTWSAVGYNRSATMTVERGGSVDVGYRIMIGRDGSAATGPSGAYPSYLNINGGTLTTVQNLQIGNNAADKTDGGGIVTVNGGLLDIGNTIQMRNTPVSYIDIGFGTIIWDGSRISTAEDWRDAVPPNLMAFGGVGTLVFSYDSDADKTTITATGDPLNRDPTYDGFSSWDPTLSWNNLPAVLGSQVWVDVRFGTDATQDPNSGLYPNFGKVLDKSLLTNVGVTTPANGVYLWRVYSYLHGDPAHGQYNTGEDPNLDGYPVDEGILMPFFATDDFPPEVVIDTPPTATWRDEPITLNATVYDDGTTEVTVTWTSNMADPNITFTNPQYSEIADPCNPGDIIGTATVDVTVNYNSGAFTVTATATDGNPIGADDADTVGLDCRLTPCGAARNGVGLADDYLADLAVDCEHDLADFAVIAADWLDDYALTGPTVMP